MVESSWVVEVAPILQKALKRIERQQQLQQQQSSAEQRKQQKQPKSGQQRQPSPTIVIYTSGESALRETMVQPRLEPVVAESRRPAQPLSEVPSDGPALVLTCQDPNNTGTIIRTAVAYGPSVGGSGGQEGGAEAQFLFFGSLMSWRCKTFAQACSVFI